MNKSVNLNNFKEYRPFMSKKKMRFRILWRSKGKNNNINRIFKVK